MIVAKNLTKRYGKITALNQVSFTIEPGVKVLRRGDSDDWPDGRNVHSLDGRFRIVGDKLSVSRCQPIRAG